MGSGLYRMILIACALVLIGFGSWFAFYALDYYGIGNDSMAIKDRPQCRFLRPRMLRNTIGIGLSFWSVIEIPAL